MNVVIVKIQFYNNITWAIVNLYWLLIKQPLMTYYTQAIKGKK